MEFNLPMGLDADKIAIAATELTGAPAARPRLDLRQLPSLEMELKNMQEHLAHREKIAARLRPEAKILEADVAAKNRALEHLEAGLKAMNLLDGGDAAWNLEQDLVRAVDELEAIKVRLATNEGCAASWRKLIQEWPYHKELAELRRAQKLLDQAGY